MHMLDGLVEQHAGSQSAPVLSIATHSTSTQRFSTWRACPPLPAPQSGGLHWRDDELVPFEQSVQLAEEPTRRGHPHEFYAYDGPKHYFSTSADNATTQRMFQDSLDCLRRWLECK